MPNPEPWLVLYVAGSFVNRAQVTFESCHNILSFFFIFRANNDLWSLFFKVKCFLSTSYKVHIFWEGHKILRKVGERFRKIFVAFLEYMNFSKIESFAISSPLSATSNNLPICHINLRYKSTLSLLSYSTWIKKPNNMMRTFPQPLFQMVL